MLENLSERLQSIFTKLRSKGRLSEDDINAAMKEIRMALLEADVNFKVVKSFINTTKEKCLTADVLESLTPAQNVIKKVLEELTVLLGSEDTKLKLTSRIPNVIMLVGLQGSGKTTAAAKLAYLLKQQKHNPMLVACDIYRPAAADQLETLGKEIGVRVYREIDNNPIEIAKNGVKDAIDNLRDIVIIDTAGRLHVDEEMMNEAQSIKDAVDADQTFMVVDAMTGQDVVNVASSFAEKVDFDGVIMSKMDGDARGGGALSIRQVTGKPIVFISSGEKPDSLEEFHPERMAKRILGMGDVVSLIETASKIETDKFEAKQANRLQKANLNMNDFLTLQQQINKIGGIQKLVTALPGGDRALKDGQVNENALDQMVIIINSMTNYEREHPECLNGSRRSRVANGAGVEVYQVNQLMKKFYDARKVMKKMMAAQEQNSTINRKGKKGKKGRNKKRRSLSGISGMSSSDLKKMKEALSGLED